MKKNEWVEKINQLRKEMNAVILAHYYQEGDVQDIADYVGDSLELSRKAAAIDADVIVFAGVHFMAETAKILNPAKKVLLPDLQAGCSLADSCPAEEFRKFRLQYPDHVAVTYINCSAEVKALSDWVCTSANAVKVIQSIPEDKKILFAPDKNLGDYLIRQTGREMVLWDGVCVVHEAFSLEKLVELVKAYPSARIIAHPESDPILLKIAHFVGSTSAMLKYVQEDSRQIYIVGTEEGILHQMQKFAPEKTLIPVPAVEDNTCACSQCAYMKLNTLEKLYQCMIKGGPEINLDPALIEKALIPIQKMLSLP
ncbi:quinolinate synthase NadA [Negadavirga shengliensis]|uniref:Quinolinate synthase n=1 Tax=Negadavirga shengliensis TaxID=1389218 RepID=A0ABV9SYH9_9BACT